MLLPTLALVCTSLQLAAAEPKVVSMPIRRAALENLEKRAASISVDLSEPANRFHYEVSAAMGTPQQTIPVLLDTGSSDLWVFSSSSCGGSGCANVTFDSSKSSSFQTTTQNGFGIGYADGSKVTGDLATDNVGIGGAEITNLTFGLASNGSTTSGTGILGIGFAANEAPPGQYPNIIDQMVSEKLINTRAYSLYLDDLQASTGTILFGGIDTAKYAGDLTVVDIIPNQNGDYKEFNVAWTWFSITDSTGTTILTDDNFANISLLDSGNSLTRVGPDLFNILATYFEVVVDPLNGPLLSCDWSSVNGSLDYGFGGVPAVVSVPFSEIAITPVPPITFDDGSSACLFGFASTNSDASLGDTFLRSAYVVYDLDDKQIGLANSLFNVTDSNVIEFQAAASSGAPALASGVSTAANQPQITQTASQANLAPAPIQTINKAQTVSVKANAKQPGKITGKTTSLPPKQTGSNTAKASGPATTTSKSSAHPAALPPFSFGMDLFVICGSLFAMFAGGIMTVLL